MIKTIECTVIMIKSKHHCRMYTNHVIKSKHHCRVYTNHVMLSSDTGPGGPLAQRPTAVTRTDGLPVVRNGRKRNVEATKILMMRGQSRGGATVG